MQWVCETIINQSNADGASKKKDVGPPPDSGNRIVNQELAVSGSNQSGGGDASVTHPALTS